MKKVNIDRDKLGMVVPVEQKEILLTEVVQEDDVGQRVETMLRELTNIQTQYTRYPVISEEAGVFTRWFQRWKMKHYEEITRSEAEISIYQNVRSKEVLEMFQNAALFIRKVKNEAAKLDHEPRMLQLDYELKLQDVEKAKAETQKVLAEAELIRMEAEQMRADIDAQSNRRAKRVEVDED